MSSENETSRVRELMLATATRDDRAAFQELVRILTPALTRTARDMAPPDMVPPVSIDDIVKETWTRAWKYRHTFPVDDRPFNWLHQILTSVLADGDRALVQATVDRGQTRPARPADTSEASFLDDGEFWAAIRQRADEAPAHLDTSLARELAALNGDDHHAVETSEASFLDDGEFWAAVRQRADEAPAHLDTSLARELPPPPFTRLVQDWIGKLPVVPPAMQRVLGELNGVSQTVAVGFGVRWAAYLEVRRQDAAIRLGMWLGLGGLTTAVLGLLGLPLRLAWAKPQVGFGIALVVVGYYLGATREHLQEGDDAPPLANRRARRHRKMLACALLVLAVLAVWTSLRFHPPVPATTEVIFTKFGMAIGAVLAAAACVVMFFVLTVFHRPVPVTEKGQERRVRLRVLLTLASTRSAGLACVAYAATHVVASTFAHNVRMEIVLIATAGLVCLAAAECFRNQGAYFRPLFIWSSPRLRDGPAGVAAATKAVQEHQASADADPAQSHELAASLHLLALRDGELGRREEAFEHAEEAVRIRTTLALADVPGPNDLARQGDRAASLHLLAVRLRELNRREEALEHAEEAVRIRRTLTSANPVYRAELKKSRDLRKYLRSELKHPKRPITQAVRTFRLLTASAAGPV